MPKIQFSDVTPPDKRSIRNVPIPKEGRRKAPAEARPRAEVKPPQPEFSAPTQKFTDTSRSEGPYEYYYPKPKKEPVRSSGSRKKMIFGGLSVLVVAAFIIGMMTVFASATISIVPKSQEFDVDMKLNAAVTAVAETVRYEVLRLSKSELVTVPATGEEAVELRASGKIIIYNNFSSDPQRLITRTRFETPEGLIYRIRESVIVPGKTVKNGEGVPGSIQVEVFADEAGEKYNIKKTDFTVPGFKSDAARYKGFYARSVTEMAGGFIGKRKTVQQNEKDAAMQNLDLSLRTALEKELQSKVPEELVLLPGAIVYESRELQPKDSASSVELGKEVTAFAVLLNKAELSSKVASRYVAALPEWQGITPTIDDFSLLNVTNALLEVESGKNLVIDIKGKANVLADIDTGLVNQRLLGAPKARAASLMDEFLGIKSLSATIRPVWKQSFPENPLRIHVQTAGN